MQAAKRPLMPPAMSDAPDKPDYRSTVFLPKTDFPMKAGLPQKEPVILAKWQAENLYKQIRDHRGTSVRFKADGDNIKKYWMPNG